MGIPGELMPKLKQLDIQGFKSFADVSTFLYPTGITAIVGPNGSGKSNIADAIRWVLGEQRLTAIRGRTGEDMIFAGSARRPRAGMARAALTFDNSDNWLPVDFAEVTVERRTYRDGTSDYMLNGSKVRLMDLRDLLDRAGLGRDAYLMIGQGLVDQVLSLRPQERLALFEQAAGIMPYRTRREDAVGRLEDTTHNLQRIYDIVGEIEPRLRRLKRQAARVEEHARLKHELEATLRTWYGYRWGRAITTLDQARQRAAYLEERALSLMQRVEQREGQVAELRQTIAVRRAKLAALHRDSGSRHDEASERQRELAVARERQRQLRERIEETEANLAPLRGAAETEREEVTSLSEALAAMDVRVGEAESQLASSEVELQALEAQRHALLERAGQARAGALETRHELADRQSRLEQAQRRDARLTEEADAYQEALTEATAKRRVQQQDVERSRRRLELAQTALRQAQEAEERTGADLETARERRESLRTSLADRQAEIQRTTARLEALDRLHTEGAGLYAGVRAVIEAARAGELTGLPGPVSSVIRVPEEIEVAIEVALGAQLQSVIATTWSDAQVAIEWLKRTRAGRATFLPLDALRPPSMLELPRVPGVLGVASQLISYDPVYESAVTLLLGRTAVARDLAAARDLYRSLQGGFRIATLDGEIVRSGGSVTGGESKQPRGPGLLTRERERRELREQARSLRRSLSGLRTEKEEADKAVAAVTEELERCVQERRQADANVREREQQLGEAVRVLERVLEEIRWVEERLGQATADRGNVRSVVDRLTNEVRERESRLAGWETVVTEVEDALTGVGDEGVARKVAEDRTALALLKQERENQRVLLGSRRRELTRLGQQITGHQQRLVSLREELGAVDEGMGRLLSQYEQARQAANKLSDEIPVHEQDLAAAESELEHRETELQTARRTLREAEQRLGQADVEASRREDQLQALRRETEEALDIVISNLPETISTQQPLPLEEIVSPLPIVHDMPQGLEGQIRDLRTQIRRLEPINPGAKEEYDELAERHGFLREQMADLERASAHLREIIEELDEMMDTMFSTTFKSVKSEFSRVFDLLFNGGSAELDLVEEGGDRIGVEITARPPGKRAGSLSMLSGGERSLTAVALIFAVMRISPTPFCVLDEVDAMLDEANVGRFRRMLRELARETQFVIITHNRGTVEVADTIYGVSMGDDGVSETLSLSLEDLPASEVI
jgi:chromosome segregation protein